jgi:hypothetical protein
MQRLFCVIYNSRREGGVVARRIAFFQALSVPSVCSSKSMRLVWVAFHTIQAAGQEDELPRDDGN